MPKRRLSPNEEARYVEFRRLIVEEREKAGLSQSELAALLDPPRPQSYVGKVEVGLRRLDALEYFDMAHAIGFDPCVLVEKLDAQTGKEKSKKFVKRKGSSR